MSVQWHLIGHLQRNKVRRTLTCQPLLHSLDSIRLLKAVQQQAAEQGLAVRGLLEVNISGDAAKHGLRPEQIQETLQFASDSCPNLAIDGLMAMASREGGAEQARRDFAHLRELRDQVAATNWPLPELSMGMSGDFEQAILEGATMVRIGSALFV